MAHHQAGLKSRALPQLYKETTNVILVTTIHCFAICKGSMGVACPVPTFSGSICPWYVHVHSFLPPFYIVMYKSCDMMYDL